VLLARVRAGGEPGHALAHRHGRVRHRSYDRHSIAEVTLDQRRRDRGCDRDDRLRGLHRVPEVGEQHLDVLWLDGDDDDLRALDGVDVDERRVDPVSLGELVEPILPPSGGDDVARLRPPRREEPGDERLPGLPGPQHADPPAHRFPFCSSATATAARRRTASR
jgi:hypothetical protein